jgi:7-carboxy-7-deazaguanine synthase
VRGKAVTYSVKEMFYTLQGEGINAGRPAVFIRFAGCNLWNGTEAGRATGKGGCAAWCDTDFVGGSMMTHDEVAVAARQLWPDPRPCYQSRPFCVLTGGEPSLQVDRRLILRLKEEGFTIAMETNGTRILPDGVNWVTVSPKEFAPLVVNRCQEVKVVWPQVLDMESILSEVRADHYLIQPMDGHPEAQGLVMAYVQTHPKWRLSLQLHKLLGLR